MVREDFGAFMLKKHGWQDGTGLGKEGTGIVKPISLKRTTDAEGVGFDKKQFEPWWDNLYDKLASKISTPKGKQEKKDKSKMKSKTKKKTSKKDEGKADKVKRKEKKERRKRSKETN